MLCVAYRNAAWVRPAWQVTWQQWSWGPALSHFCTSLTLPGEDWFIETYFILSLADITVAGLEDAWSRAKRQVLALQLATSIPNAIGKFSRSYQRYELAVNTPPPNPAGRAVLGTPPEGCALSAWPHTSWPGTQSPA